MLRKDILRAALVAQGFNPSENVLVALTNEINQQQEQFRFAESIHSNLIGFDEWIARNIPNSEVRRQAVQNQIAAWQTRFPGLTVYVPRSTAELIAQ